MIDLNELQYFVRICEARSFTVAAERLGVPKSSVSRALTRLEERLGVRLIERTTRSLVLTEAGELYLERCMRMVEEAEEADLLIGALHAKPRGLLRVGAPVPFSRFVLGPVLGEFLAAYPEVRLHLQLLGAPGATQDEGDLDVVIRPGPLEDSGLRAKLLMQVRLAVFASPAYLAGRPMPRVPADLQAFQCIGSHCSGPGLHGGTALWRLRRGTVQQEVRLEPRASVADPAIVHQLTLAGAGVALLKPGNVRAEVDSGQLVRLLPEWESEPLDLYALHASRLDASPRVRAFLEFLRQRFGDARVSPGPDPARSVAGRPALA